MGIREAERIVSSIESVMERLDEEKRKVLGWKYWGPGKEMRPAEVAAKFGMEEKDLREWRRILVHGVAAKLGWR